jgi:hypothetical protein
MMTTPAAVIRGQRIPLTYRLTLWTVLLSLIVMATMLWVVVTPAAPLTIKAPMAVMTPRVQAGQPIELVLDYCATRETFGWVGGVFSSGGVIYPHVGKWPAELPRGCHVVRLMVLTPDYLPPGSYKFYMARDYQPTVVASVQVLVESAAFEIVP